MTTVSFRRLAFRAVLGAVLIAGASGCRSLHADHDEWSKEEALDQLRGHYPEIIEVGDDSISVPNWVQGGRKPLVIKYADIVDVQVKPQAKAFVLWPITATLYGPFLYDMSVTLKNGWTVPIIRKCRWATGFTPMGYFPNVLVFGYEPGYALDWLRQDAQGWPKGEGSAKEAPR